MGVKSIKKQFVYTKEPAFINRQKELKYFSAWIDQRPENILFIHGPKSSGKTTLLMKFIEKIGQNKNFDIKFFNLRKLLIINYTNFIQTFFEVDVQRSKSDVKEKKEYNLKVFKLTREVVKGLEEKKYDPFIVMDKELHDLCKKGKRPVIIIDELQALDNIYMNGQRELLKELFNFFVAITKESHTCHVIISSSDGYFLNRIYEDCKLSKTSNFLEIDYLNKEEIKYWLSNLEKESSIKAFVLSDFQIETIWHYFGGSIWEISNILGELLNDAVNKKISDEDLKKNIMKIVDQNYGKFLHYSQINKSKILLLKKIYEIFQQKDSFNTFDLRGIVQQNILNEDSLTQELNNLVRLNYISFNPVTNFYKLQGKSMFYGLKKYVGNIPEDFLS